MPKIDLTDAFEEFFVGGGENTNSVREVYNIIPTFNQEQLNIITAYSYYAEKYDLDHIRKFLDSVMKLQGQNKNLSFFDKQSANRLLRAYTVDELLGRIKPSISHVDEQERGN